MLIKYYCLTVLVCVLQHFTAVSGNALRIGSEHSLPLSDCNKNKLLQYPDSSSIIDLNLHHCYIPTLENEFFIRFTALSNLEITNSQLSSLEDYALNGLKHLRALSLADNNLTDVNSWSNEQMLSLISLDLKRNAIRKLTLRSFSRYPNLQRLNLMGNLLEDIDDDIFRWMPQLKYLNLGHNRLIALENRSFQGMHRLLYLALHFNVIEKVQKDSFGTNNHLRTLRLEGNKLNSVDFLKAKSLMRLQHLNLSFNELETLVGMNFSKDFEIVSLDLSHNHLKAINGNIFKGLDSLEKLNISHNSLTQLEPKLFDELFSLKYLNLNHNDLQHLPKFIFNLTKQLQHIDLSHNKLARIDATLFSMLSDLKSLDLSQNQLNSDDFITNLANEVKSHQVYLNLSDNNYRIINISALLSFEQVELAGNWWSCKWLIKEMFQMPKYIDFGRSYAIHSDWSLSLLEANGINCYDEDSRRNIIILDTSKIWEQKFKEVMCSQHSSLEVQPSPPPISWPRIKLDRFDSRSVVLWMLLAIALAFSALRIGRKLVDQKESKRKLRKFKDLHKHQLENQALKKSFEEVDTDSPDNLKEKCSTAK